MLNKKRSHIAPFHSLALKGHCHQFHFKKLKSLKSFLGQVQVLFHCQINHGFSLCVTLVSLLFLWVFRASHTRVSRDSACLFKQTNLGFWPLSPSNAALDQRTIFCFYLSVPASPKPRYGRPRRTKCRSLSEFDGSTARSTSSTTESTTSSPTLTTSSAQVGEVFSSSFLFYFSFLCAVVLGVFVFGSWFSFVAFYYAFCFLLHLLMVWVCHMLCVSLAFSVALCSRPAGIVSLFLGLFIFVYSRFAPCTLCFAHLGIFFCYFALSAYLCLSR